MSQQPNETGPEPVTGEDLKVYHVSVIEADDIDGPLVAQIAGGPEIVEQTAAKIREALGVAETAAAG